MKMIDVAMKMDKAFTMAQELNELLADIVNTTYTEEELAESDCGWVQAMYNSEELVHTIMEAE
jgi:hypothetical protein